MTAARVLSSTPQLPERLTSLDGLRGVASLVVLAHHSLLTVPALARAYYPGQRPVPQGSIAWWLTYTPLHLAWAGTEAVFLFFVLSGLVVVLPALRNPGFDWMAFYPRRIIRIYGPVVVALALGVVLMVIVPRFDDHTLGRWMNARPDSFSVSKVLSDLMLVNGNSGIVSPLWSLQWEILFSAFLPAFVAIGVIGRRRPKTVGAVVAVAVVLGSMFEVRPLFYFALFAIGTLIAATWDRIAAVASAMARRRLAWPIVFLLALGGTTAMWWSQGLGLSFEHATTMRWIAVPGVVLLLLAAAFWRPAVRLLDTRLLQWLGRISFSLYLVHEPIVTASRFALVHLHAPTWVSIAVAVPVAIGVAGLFTRFVEAPFHRLAKAVGRRVTAASHDLGRPARVQPDVASGAPSAAVARRAHERASALV